jgi:hypothetical protein
VVAQIRDKLGFKNENLIGFGILPRKRNRSKKTDKTPSPISTGTPPLTAKPAVLSAEGHAPADVKP